MALLIDVRERHERENDGCIPNSLHISRGLLEFQVDPESPAYVKELTVANKLILYCGTGGRSALAAKTLIEMGFPDVASLVGGYAAWHLAQT
jgi:rhodanese-related sulfurtransferase